MENDNLLILSLPDDVLSIIFSLVNEADRWIVGMVSKRFREVIFLSAMSATIRVPEGAFRPLDYVINRALDLGGTATIRMLHRKPSCHWKSALTRSARRDDVAMLDALCTAGRYGALSPKDVLTCSAVSRGNVAAAEYMYESVLRGEYELDMTAISCSILSGNVDMLRWVLRKNPAIEKCFDWTSLAQFLTLSANEDNVDMFKEIVERCSRNTRRPPKSSWKSWNMILEKATVSHSNSIVEHVLRTYGCNKLDFQRILRAALCAGNVHVVKICAGASDRSFLQRSDREAIEYLFEYWQDSMSLSLNMPFTMTNFASMAAVRGDTRALALVRKSDMVEIGIAVYAADVATLGWFERNSDRFVSTRGKFHAVWNTQSTGVSIADVMEAHRCLLRLGGACTSRTLTKLLMFPSWLLPNDDVKAIIEFVRDEILPFIDVNNRLAQNEIYYISYHCAKNLNLLRFLEGKITIYYERVVDGACDVGNMSVIEYVFGSPIGEWIHAFRSEWIVKGLYEAALFGHLDVIERLIKLVDAEKHQEVLGKIMSACKGHDDITVFARSKLLNK